MADVRQGRIQRIVRERGYGYIQVQEGQMVFFHRDDLIGIPFDQLQKGMKVEFLFIPADPRPRAKDVRPYPPPGAQSGKPESQPANPPSPGPRGGR